MSNKLSITLPGREYPYNNCELVEGEIEQIGKEKVVFKTVSRAGIKRTVTVLPNGLISELEHDTEDTDEQPE